MMPGNAALKMETRTYRIRTMVGDQPNHSAMPPQTPAIMRLRDFLRGMWILHFFIKIYGNYAKMVTDKIKPQSEKSGHQHSS
jgi:hypothetical protein